jgi:ABC-2 type transport system ATP-binding protein
MLKQEILDLKKNGATIIFSTHNMSSVEEICDHIALIHKSKKILDGPIDVVRKTYSSDIYEIKFAGFFNKLETTLTSDYKILEVLDTNQGGSLKVELLNKEMGSNELISRMLKFGNVCSFQKHLPSMNDIFIKVVGDTNAVTE